jgi:hypothetical protein
MTTSNRKYHRGLGFDLWTNRGAWFWRLASRRCGAGTIGSALTENEALHEAYAAVEEVSARYPRAAPSPSVSSAAVNDWSPRQRFTGYFTANGGNSAMNFKATQEIVEWLLR